MKMNLFILCLCLISFISNSQAAERGGKMNSTYNQIYAETPLKDGVKEISYDQFVKLRKSGDDYVLFDVLYPDSYKEGHIEDAENFPVDKINKKTAKRKLSKGSSVVVYCGSFQCGASTESARKLQALGYKVLDYKGGLKEWREKGNKLVK